MRLRRRVTSLTLVISTLITTTGCATWRVEPAPLPAVLQRQPPALKVETVDSSLVLHRPSLTRDSLTRDSLRGFSGRQEDSRPIPLATADIRSVSTRRAN